MVLTYVKYFNCICDQAVLNSEKYTHFIFLIKFESYEVSLILVVFASNLISCKKQKW